MVYAEKQFQQRPDLNLTLQRGRICRLSESAFWRYDANGHVVHIPSVDAEQGEPKSPGYRYRQRHFAVCEQDGLVWVYTGTGDAHGTPIFRLPAYGERPWQSYFMINTFDADVGSLVQNFLDVPHTVFVHEGIFRSSSGRAMEATLACKAQSI